MTPGQRTYCPVSGVVFTVQEASSRRAAGDRSLYFCCASCAAYFAAAPERVLALRGLGPIR